MRRRSPVPIIIVAAWVFMAVLLVKREYFTAEPSWRPGTAHFDTAAVEEWVGIYLQGQKIGYGRTMRVSQGDTLYRINSAQVLRIVALGRAQVINSRSEATLNSDFSLRSFLFAIYTDDAYTSLMVPGERPGGSGTALEIEGGVSNGVMKVEVRQGAEAKGEGEERVIAVGGPLYFDVGPEMLLADRGLEVGRTITIQTFDPTTMGIASSTIEVAGHDTLDFHGERIGAWRLETEFAGLQLTSWVDREGSLIRSEAPLGITIDRESREKALEEGWDRAATLDLVNLASIPAGVMKIEAARQLDSLTVRLGGIELSDADITFGRQELVEELVEVKKEDLTRLEDYVLPNRERALRRYLESTPFVQSDHPAIRRRAAVVRRGTRSAREFAEKLVQYVYDYLEKVPTAGIPNAVEVLRRREGDCNEHTVLYTALARASGLPTLMNAGVVYMDGRFYYHAWPSVWLGRWVAVDPTFEQFPADASHISLMRGDIDRYIELMKVVGRITIDILSYYPLPGGSAR